MKTGKYCRRHVFVKIQCMSDELATRVSENNQFLWVYVSEVCWILKKGRVVNWHIHKDQGGRSSCESTFNGESQYLVHRSVGLAAGCSPGGNHSGRSPIRWCICAGTAGLNTADTHPHPLAPPPRWQLHQWHWWRRPPWGTWSLRLEEGREGNWRDLKLETAPDCLDNSSCTLTSWKWL